MNYYEHHLGDYIRDTAHLSLAEDGAYRRLLDVYYAREQPFSICEKSIFRLVRANNRHEQLAVLAVLREFFVKDGDCYRNHRCDKEIARFREKSAKAKASANARWDKSERNANALPTQCEGNAPSNQSPVTSNQEEKIRGDSAAADAARSPPKKASRAKARTTFPPDFALTDSDRAYALERCPDMNVPATFEDFRNHHTAKGTLGADWHAGWRTWIGNCQKGFVYVRTVRPASVAVKSEQISPAEWRRRQAAAGS